MEKLIPLIGLSLLIAACTPQTGNDPRVMGEPEIPYEATFTGKTECLPHRDTSGPQTMECAFGLLSDDGYHIALDLSVYSGEAGSFETDQRMTVHGMFVPVEQLSSDQWQKYNVLGILQVTEMTKE